MIDNSAQMQPTEAVIYFKDGKRKYGMLMDTISNGVFHFISNSNLIEFQETKNPDYIEIFSGGLIEAIDIDLK